MSPEWRSELLLRLKALFRRRQLDRDLKDEMSFHLAMREKKLRTDGAAPDEAPSAARRRFGNETRTMEACRELWTFRWIETLWQDVRYGARVLRKNPGFAAVAVLSLSLGIGANTSIFTLINAVVLKNLPVPNPDELVVMNWTSKSAKGALVIGRNTTDKATGRQITNAFAYPVYRHIRDSAQRAEVFGFAGLRQVNLNIGDRATVATGVLASGNYHQVLGLRPAIGRLLNDGDDRPGAEPVAVISDRLWDREFGRRASVIGEALTVNGTPFTVIGVTPREFYGLVSGGLDSAPDVTVSIAQAPLVAREWMMGEDSALFSSGWWWIQMMARRSGAVAMPAVQAEMDVLFAQALAEVEEQSTTRLHDSTITVDPCGKGLDYVREHYSRMLWALFAIVGLVLLLACANIANLLLARASARQQEIAVRLAIGAGRWRLVRQLLTEGMLLAFLGGAIGVGLSFWGSRIVMVKLLGVSGAVGVSMTPDLRVLAFTIVVSIVTGLLFAAVPALQASRVSLAPDLKQSTRAAGTARHGAVLGRALVVVQVSIALLLVAGAGLFLRTLTNLGHIDLGIRADGLLLFRLSPGLNGYEPEKLTGYYKRVLDGVRAIPGVESATSMQHRLFSGWMSNAALTVPGAESLPENGLPVHVNAVGPDFFETMGIPVLTGRGVVESDTKDALRIGIINRSLATKAFPDASPLGRTIHYPFTGTPIEIVGVVEDARYARVQNDDPPTLYVPNTQIVSARLDYVLRTRGRPEALVSQVRAVVHEIDPNIPLSDVTTQQRQIDDSIRTEHLFAEVSAVFGVVALLLASIGIYGVLAFAVARRTGEMGIRMALGANRANISWLVMRQMLVLVAVGIIVGLAAAAAATKLVAAQLYGVEPGDPMTLAAAVAVIAAVAAAAGYLPARRASRLDPVDALRSE